MRRNNIDLRSFDPLAGGGGPPAPPPVSNNPPVAPHHGSWNASQNQHLQQQGFSSGLIRAFASIKHTFPLRIWILDNSESMNIKDSHRICGTFNNIQNVSVTRWQELQDCVAYHSNVAAQFQMRTRFALLNDPKVGPQYFSVGEKGPTGLAQEMQSAQHVMTQTRPAGPTLLTPQLAGLKQYIVSIAPQLRQHNQTVTIVLATQGLPTSDQSHSGPAVAHEFVQTLKSLEGLPVWVVIRLCTDDETVFDFYNSLDTQVDLPFDVLDDFFGESLEVYLRNPWLNYGLPLHRFREMGFRIPVLDAIEERALTVQQVRDLCSLLFATQAPLPDPSVNWNAFLHAVTGLMGQEKQQWNPVTRKVAPWINLQHLNRLYGGSRQAPPQPFPATQQPAGYYPTQQSVPPQQANYAPRYQQAQYPPQQPPPGRPMPTQSMPPRQSMPAQNVPSPQQQPPPTRPHAASAPPSATSQQVPAPSATASVEDALVVVKQGILTQWGLQPPQFQAPRPIEYLLATLHTTFPPANGVKPHEYFSKWKPFSVDALNAGQPAVIKRAVRKCKFFLHPDKLPKDFTEKQKFLCRTLWDVTADAWEASEAKQ